MSFGRRWKNWGGGAMYRMEYTVDDLPYAENVAATIEQRRPGSVVSVTEVGGDSYAILWDKATPFTRKDLALAERLGFWLGPRNPRRLQSVSGFGGRGADIIVVDREGNVLEKAKEGIPQAVIARGRFDSRHFVESNLPYSSIARKHGTEVLGVEASFTEPDRHQIRVIVATPQQRGHWEQGDADRWELFSIPGRNRAAKALNTALRRAMKMIDSKLKLKSVQRLDPSWNEEDRRKIAQLIAAAYEKYMRPALRKYSEWGASDTEGHYHAKYALVDYVKRKMGWWDASIEDYL